MMVEYLGEEVFVTDGKGNVIYINPTSERILNLPLEAVVGRNVADLVKEGHFSKSSTLEVLKTGKPVNIIQKLRDGRSVLATGVPKFGKDGKIEMVITTSKDVAEINHLLDKVKEQTNELNLQAEELNALREGMFKEEGFIAFNKTMKDVKDTIMRIASLDMTVLIEGETGVGKEVAAKALHRFSYRCSGPFIKINCGMIPENLFESELFGYEGGSFTDANKEGKLGKIELADKGTLLLDEIGEMPYALQIKLNDFLQDNTFVRVGGTKRIKADVRVIAATNRNLKKMCDEKLFRQDLYYRLSVIPLYIPPLRTRLDDIEYLALYYLSRFNSKYKGYKRLGDGLVGSLTRYDWPGNIRELEHVLERLYVITEGNVLTAEGLDKLIKQDDHTENYDEKVICKEIIPLKEAKRQIEKQLISMACQRYGSSHKAAEALGIDQSTIIKFLKKDRTISDENNPNDR